MKKEYEKIKNNIKPHIKFPAVSIIILLLIISGSIFCEMIAVGKVIITELIEYCIKILIIYIRNGKIMENKERKIYRILKTVIWSFRIGLWNG